MTDSLRKIARGWLFEILLALVILDRVKQGKPLVEYILAISH